MKHSKIWGWTLEIFKNYNFEIHLIYIKKNHKCSEHLHKYKFNMFFILYGELIINIQTDANFRCKRLFLPINFEQQ